jgi:uncharacterized protein YbgA (DUF1722 family)
LCRSRLAASAKRFPLLPVEEEGRLNDLPLRENFIARVFAYYRWTRMLEEEPTPGGLVKFHTAHKLTLMAHSPKHYTEMGRLVADAGKREWNELTAEYGAMLMEGLGVMGTRGKHVNVLQHLMGYLKNHLSAKTRPTFGRLELLSLIEDYPQGGQTAADHRPEMTAEAVLRLLPRRVPLARGPEPLSNARAGARASSPPSVPHGAVAAQSRVGPSFVAAWGG